MRTNKVLLGGRYQYNPNECLRTTDLYRQFRAYDKVTKRQLILQKHPQRDPYVQKIRQVKHTFIHQVFDVIQIQGEQQTAIFFEPGVHATLEDALTKNHYLTQNDALVVFKYVLIALQELHHQMLTYDRMCPKNVLFCTHSIIKLGTVAYPLQTPLATRSPETLREERPNYQSDVYSLGIVLYKLLYGCYPFAGDSEGELLENIKNKQFEETPTNSPLKILVTKQTKVLVKSMLDYQPKNRPSLDQILNLPFLQFPIETDIQTYIKPKGNIMPQPFLRRYLLFRPSKIIYRIDDYYEQSCYLALSIKQKQFTTLWCPDVKMVEAEPRRVDAYYQKLRAIKDSYISETCGFLVKVQDHDRFRREPVLMLEYCNQGDLFHYLQKLKSQNKALTQKQVLVLMYLLAIALKQMKQIGVTSIHTIHCQRIMIKNRNIKLREPGILTPFLDNKLVASTKLDYFAPELKERSEYVELGTTDMWSFGMVFYYLLKGTLPELNPLTNSLNIDNIQTNKKNKNIIGRCLDQNVERRLTLEMVKMQGVNEKLLQDMLQEKRMQDQADEDLSSQQQEQKYKDDNRVMFRNKNKKWCRNYNKIIALSSSSLCRLITKTLLGLVILYVFFFGLFFVNGGVGMLRTNYYRKITLQVPYNYATALKNITILSVNGSAFENEYKDYSFEQLTLDLNCTQNNHSSIASGQVHDYINYSHSAQCVFGFIFMIFFSIAYGLMQFKLDLPKLMVEKKAKNSYMGLFHLVTVFCCLNGLLFCFFTIFALEYIIQMSPCLGIANPAYPEFTSVQTLLNGNVGDFFRLVFPTAILWSIFMFLYVFLGLLHRKLKIKALQIKSMLIFIGVMLIYTIVCRVGFGSGSPLQPSWSYKINTDITSMHWGLFGLFPQVIMIALFIMDRLIDCLFWFFLRLDMEPKEQQQIREVEFVIKMEPASDVKIQDRSNHKFNIGHDFQIFD